MQTFNTSDIDLLKIIKYLRSYERALKRENSISISRLANVLSDFCSSNATLKIRLSPSICIVPPSMTFSLMKQTQNSFVTCKFFPREAWISLALLTFLFKSRTFSQQIIILDECNSSLTITRNVKNHSLANRLSRRSLEFVIETTCITFIEV